MLGMQPKSGLRDHSERVTDCLQPKKTTSTKNVILHAFLMRDSDFILKDVHESS